jgi:hypothetical protein
VIVRTEKYPGLHTPRRRISFTSATVRPSARNWQQARVPGVVCSGGVALRRGRRRHPSRTRMTDLTHEAP